MKKILFFLIIISFCTNTFALEIKSEVFKQKGYIPDRYSCDAQDFSPSLSWSQVPQGTKSLAIICDDPDAPFKIWVHWVIFNIPSGISSLEENISKEKLNELSAVEGLNDFGRLGYNGPCPPAGKPHRYFFTLYALDTTLSLEEGVGKKELVEAMQGHILAETKVIGLYQRK
tara:strand:- start:68 stop:583 length:516 start_codon:yes stop_codon:yes gene_type:complete